MDIITTHLNADFDALASMIAAKKFYPDAIPVFPGSQEKTVREFLSLSPLPVEIKKMRDIDFSKISRLILVDVKSPSRIGRFSEIITNNKIVIHIYDHHPVEEDDIRGQKEVIENVGATTTIFTEMIKNEKIEISPSEATLLMLGIYEETGSLLFPSTTVRDLMAAAYLLKKGANLNIVSKFIKKDLGPEEIDLLNELIHSSKEVIIHDIKIAIATATRETYIGDIASLAHKIREIRDVDVIFLIIMMEGRVQLIARSYIPEVDVSEILHELGGGGHPQAASAVIRDMGVEETRDRLLEILTKKVRPSMTAKDIMTSPVKCIEHTSTIKNAEKMLTKFGVNVLPVLKDGKYYGIISREVVEKAIFHGFGRSKVYEFCTTDVPCVTPDTSIKTIESTMIEQNQRFLPVIQDDHIVGAITRTDLLRSIYETILRKERLATDEKLSVRSPVGKNLTSIMKAKFPPEVFDLLKMAGEVAEELGFSAYLVGGSVRDLLMGETNLDIDIVIEGDGIVFAKELGKRLNARVRTHARFGTAVVITDFLKFDVATARTEYYESPAALPRIEASSIKKDLYRRDFTINTMAVKLNPEHFGKLIDFFGGQKDIKEKTIRVLHNLSFIEDPTRAFRAIRFSERFGFTISKHTLNLIRTAVKINLFERLSGSRMYDELKLLFTETNPLRAIKRLHELDLLKFIHPSIKLDKRLEETFISLQETLAWFKLLFLKEEINKPHLYLMALIEGLSPPERMEALNRLDMPEGKREEIIKGIEIAHSVLHKIVPTSPKDTYHALHGLDLETVLFAMAKAGDEQKRAISLYLTGLRNIRTEITGDDLKAMGYKPGPIFKKILGEVLDQKIEGKLHNREDELKFVRERFPLEKIEDIAPGQNRSD